MSVRWQWFRGVERRTTAVVLWMLFAAQGFGADVKGTGIPSGYRRWSPWGCASSRL